MKKIIVKHEERVSVMNEDGEFCCGHINVIFEPPCCTYAGKTGYIECACGGLGTIYCEDCQNKELKNWQIDEIQEREGYYV
jgi:hypothetical protein